MVVWCFTGSNWIAFLRMKSLLTKLTPADITNYKSYVKKYESLASETAEIESFSKDDYMVSLKVNPEDLNKYISKISKEFKLGFTPYFNSEKMTLHFIASNNSKSLIDKYSKDKDVQWINFEKITEAEVDKTTKVLSKKPISQ
jgi:hypothetical protein